MAIDVQWQDERGVCISRYDGPPIEGRLPARAASDSACLRFIDPYGDTTFNLSQIEVLERELESLQLGDDAELAQQRDALLAFIQRMPDRLHRYLKFIGD